MAFLYVNPGYAELTIGGGVTQVKDGITQFQNENTNTRICKIPKDADDFWLKVTRNSGSPNYGYILLNIPGQAAACGIRFNSRDFSVYLDGKEGTAIKALTSIYTTKLSIVVHWHFGKTDGYVEFWTQGDHYKTELGSVCAEKFSSTTEWNRHLYIDSEYKDNFWYDIIAGDYDIRNEHYTEVDLTEVSNTWDNSSGALTANKVGQEIKVKLDGNALKTTIDSVCSPGKITGITMCGLNMSYGGEVAQMRAVINDGTEDIYTDTESINSLKSVYIPTYVKDMSVYTASKMTFSLKAFKG